MDELQDAYERAHRSLLWRLRPRHLERGVRRLAEMAETAIAMGRAPETSYLETYQRVRQRVMERLVRARELARGVRGAWDADSGSRTSAQTRLVLESSIASGPVRDSPDFHCDSGLGGMARWLRAAGYDARFWPRIDDDSLIELTQHSNAILLTTDRPLMNRSAVAWGAVPALLVPLEVGKHAQFRFASERLGLPRKSPRCMSCGGSLRTVAKEAMRHRIPPRTYPWRDEYFQCARCEKLFWQGTHWQNVERLLKATPRDARVGGDEPGG